jgi:SAM-dependent methyltransferase
MFRVASFISAFSGGFRRTVNREFYQYLDTVDSEREVIFMNYGYLDPDATPTPLKADDEPFRRGIELYHHVASGIDLAGLDALEVGSGRGGGASYVKRYHQPKTMTGLDYSDKAVAFCQGKHQVEGLSYRHGDAENMPFADGSFDAVINVESSHCYGVMAKFLSEVHRVLRPGGHLLWTDLRPPAEVDGLRRDIADTGFTVEKEEVITPFVLNSMVPQGERNRDLIDRRVPRIFRPIFYHFAGVEGTQIYNRLADGGLTYLYMVLKKADG